MSEETTTVEPKVEEVADSVETLEIVGVVTKSFSGLITANKKGKGKGRPQLFLQPAEGQSLRDLQNDIRQVVGEENYDKCVQGMIRQACMDSTTQAIQASAEGKLSDVGFSDAFVQWWLPTTRRSGVHIKDLREKAQELFSELNPLLLRHFQFKPGQEGALAESEHNRMLQLTLEYSDLNAKIEEKSRKGKKAATK